MEQLTHLQTSCSCAHVTQILNKVEEILAKEINELAHTYLKTNMSQLEKKHGQIIKFDEKITELIQDPDKLEEAIMDAEEVQDLIIENINELNK